MSELIDSIQINNAAPNHDAIQKMLAQDRSPELHIHSFLMAGQSNMAGRGPLEGAEVILDDRCFMLRMGRWQTMVEPVNIDRSPWSSYGPQSGAGPAARFAQLYAETYNQNVGLIPCADGGTSIDQWAPGGVLFDNAVFQAKLAMRTSTFSGILWHQGESDCKCMDTVYAYEEKFLATMEAFRRELGNVPILVGELGRPEHGFDPDRADFLNEFNRRLPDLVKKLPNCRFASSKDLICKGDGFHFDTAGARKLGERYFAEYQALVQNPDSPL